MGSARPPARLGEDGLVAPAREALQPALAGEPGETSRVRLLDPAERGRCCRSLTLRRRSLSSQASTHSRVGRACEPGQVVGRSFSGSSY